MFALLEIARIYKALKRFGDLQGPICYNDAQNIGMNLKEDERFNMSLKGGNSIYPLVHRFILYYQASERA